MGRTEASLAEGRMATELDPASVSIRRSLGWLHYYARQPGEALEHLRRALAMNPTAEENHRLLGLAYLQMGLHDESAAAFREAVASSESPALATAGLGRVAVARGRLTEARAILDDLYAEARERYVSPRGVRHVARGSGRRRSGLRVAGSRGGRPARLARLSQGRAAARSASRRAPFRQAAGEDAAGVVAGGTRAQRPRASRRNAEGDRPVRRRKTLEKWLWSANPAASAISASGRSPLTS